MPIVLHLHTLLRSMDLPPFMPGFPEREPSWLDALIRKPYLDVNAHKGMTLEPAGGAGLQDLKEEDELHQGDGTSQDPIPEKHPHSAGSSGCNATIDAVKLVQQMHPRAGSPTALREQEVLALVLRGHDGEPLSARRRRLRPSKKERKRRRRRSASQGRQHRPDAEFPELPAP